MDTASVNDNERYIILDLNAIPMLTYRSLKKIDWAGKVRLTQEKEYSCSNRLTGLHSIHFHMSKMDHPDTQPLLP